MNNNQIKLNWKKILLSNVLVLVLIISAISSATEDPEATSGMLATAAVILVVKMIVQKTMPKKEYDSIKYAIGESENLEKTIDNLKLVQSDMETQAGELEKQFNTRASELENQIKQKEKEYESKKTELDLFISEMDLKITEAYIDTRDYSEITSSEIKNEISLLGLKEKELIKDGAVTFPSDWKVKEVNSNKRIILKAFNADFDNAIMKMTYSNVDSVRAKIVKAFETTNKAFEQHSIQIKKNYLELKLEELNLLYQYQKKLEIEKEQQKAIKEQILEEEKVRREIEKRKKEIAKEEQHFKSEQRNLMNYLSKANNDVEKELYLQKIKELEEKVKQLEIDKEMVLERELNTRAGYVYIISNIGSFGENVYKIGLTRRLEPMDRVKELGSASVPFEFDVHAMIFSDDAPKLENILHRHFRKQEINKVNSRKEFFRVSLSEIEQVVKENYNATVQFTELAKAEQYRESLRIQEQESR